MVEEQLGLRSEHCAVSKAVSTDKDLRDLIKAALQSDSFLVFTIEKFTAG